MLVSIIIPSYNQGKFIRETIDSVLAQDYRPIEVLVLDGASKDETVDVLRSYGPPVIPSVVEGPGGAGGAPHTRPAPSTTLGMTIQWWSEADKGVCDAVNKGLARATGTIQAIQSSDDTFLPGAIRAAVNAFDADPALGLVYGDVEYIDASSKHIGRTNLPPFTLGAYVAKQLFIPQPSAFFTKSAADRARGWNENVSYAADADFYLRIATIAPVKKLDALLGQYRYHEEQRDRIGGRIARDWEKAVRAWIEREHPSRELRRQAELGIHLTHAHYLGDAQWPKRTLELYRALLASPSVIAHPDFMRRELLPGRTPIWKFLSRVKRAMGFPPKR